MSCNFEFPVGGDVEAALEKAREAVESQNGTFTGDTNAGDFELNVFGNFIKGSYTISGETLNLEITDKPFFVPCNMIESYLKKYIS
ncbi:MAG: hypothetical protein J5I50_09995 [Chitinophagaceae bacterium]|nr:hypothetical protein [Chitinophagaceae bacterium]